MMEPCDVCGNGMIMSARFAVPSMGGEVRIFKCPVCQYQKAVRNPPKPTVYIKTEGQGSYRGFLKAQMVRVSKATGYVKRATNGGKGDLP